MTEVFYLDQSKPSATFATQFDVVETEGVFIINFYQYVPAEERGMDVNVIKCVNRIALPMQTGQDLADTISDYLQEVQDELPDDIVDGIVDKLIEPE